MTVSHLNCCPVFVGHFNALTMALLILRQLDAQLREWIPIQLDAQLRALSQCQFPRHRAVQRSRLVSRLLNIYDAEICKLLLKPVL
jgi:hypothetical protein